jgi:hypothetical protein
MSKIKVQAEAEIFDDPEYCQKSKTWCDHLRSTKNGFGIVLNIFCAQFDNKTLKILKEKPVKCPQCKAAYQKAKENVR